MAARRTDNPAVIATRGRMIGMWEAGMPLPAIAHELGVSRQTVWRWVQRWQEEGVLTTKPKSGRPKVTSRQEEQQIITTTRERPMLSSYQIIHHLQLPHYPRTTRRRLHEGGIHCFVPAVKETLSPANKEARLGFALQYLPMEPEFWETTIFTDGKVFTSVESPARQCWRPKNTRYQPENICNIKRSGRKSTSFWGEWDVGDDRTEAGIERKAREVWESVRRCPNVCSNLVKSIPSRLEEVISAFGGWSSY
ncbi:hypothetical protein Pmani_021525 [Petrolisthes manimaculis]|uniref:Transposase Tc1-like domain-containing protein n=1 Tax=Petrolisthes manimaculis TaxID=1843537 RepID=A0AAE1PEL6_9EUCA|nr:hypothetical protein Pmani_021525 [Petrolisthes manimaculis]